MRLIVLPALSNESTGLEQEFAIVHSLFGQTLDALWQYRKGNPDTRMPIAREQIFRPAFDSHERLTGLRITTPNAIMHHRIEMYGPPCG